MKKYYNLMELLKEYRQANLLTQEDLADRLEVDVRSIIRWENGLTKIVREKEATIAELLSIPFQVIRNLNADPPFATYYDIVRRNYANSAIGSVIMHASFFIDEFPKEDKNLRTISHATELRVILNHRKEVSKSGVLDAAVLIEAAKMLPELNLVAVDHSNFFAGHLCVLPLTQSSMEKLINKELNSWDIKQHHLESKTSVPNQFFVYSTYADSIASAYYLMHRLFGYFTEQKLPNYRVCCFAETEENVKLWKQTGLKSPKDTSSATLPCLLVGDFNIFLFGKSA